MHRTEPPPPSRREVPSGPGEHVLLGERVLGGMAGLLFLSGMVAWAAMEGGLPDGLTAALVAVMLTVQALELGYFAALTVTLAARQSPQGAPQFGLSFLLGGLSLAALLCGAGVAWGWEAAWILLHAALLVLLPGLSVLHGPASLTAFTAVRRAFYLAVLLVNFGATTYLCWFGLRDYLLGALGPADSFNGLVRAVGGSYLLQGLAVLTMIPYLVFTAVAVASALIARRIRRRHETAAEAN